MKPFLRVVSLACLISLSLSACVGPSSTDDSQASIPNIQQPTPSVKPVLAIDSTGWNCSSQLDLPNPIGTCSVFTFKGASTPASEGRSVPWAMFQIICQTKGKPSSTSFVYGPNLEEQSRFSWNPTKYPTLRYSVDQGLIQESTYDITAINGKVFPDSFDVDANKVFIRNLSGADTLQVWVQDYKGIEHELDFLIAGTVESVATLDAWGLNCKF